MTDRIDLEIPEDLHSRLVAYCEQTRTPLDHAIEMALAETRPEVAIDTPCEDCAECEQMECAKCCICHRDLAPIAEQTTRISTSAEAWRAAAGLAHERALRYGRALKDLLAAFPGLGKAYATRPQQEALYVARCVAEEVP